MKIWQRKFLLNPLGFGGILLQHFQVELKGPGTQKTIVLIGNDPCFGGVKAKNRRQTGSSVSMKKHMGFWEQNS